MNIDPRSVLTTKGAADIAYCSQQTIIRCFDNGSLAGFRVPGSKFRRIPLEALYRFLIENSIPTDRFEAYLGSTRRILYGTSDKPEIADSTGLDLVTASSGFGLAMAIAEFPVRAVIVDDTLTEMPTLERLIARCFCRKPKPKEAFEPWFPIPERMFDPLLLHWRVLVSIGLQKTESKHRIYSETAARTLMLPAGTTLQYATERALELLSA